MKNQKPLEKSKNLYSFPIPKEIKSSGIFDDSDGHQGPFKGAVDIIVDLGTPVLAPLKGKIVEIIDHNDKYGPTEDFIPFANLITIQHSNYELSQFVHLARNSSVVNKGDIVEEGQQIAITGSSGWMAEPHLHMLVYKFTSDENGFRGLKIRFKDK